MQFNILCDAIQYFSLTETPMIYLKSKKQIILLWFNVDAKDGGIEDTILQVGKDVAITSMQF